MDRKETASKLRKLANAIRERSDRDEAYRAKTAAHVLRAVKGLTLLRERVR